MYVLGKFWCECILRFKNQLYTQLQEKRLTNAHLAAKRAHILGVLCDLHLLDGLTERRAIAGAVLAHHADLLRAFRLN